MFTTQSLLFRDPLNRRLGGRQIRPGRLGEEINLFSLSGIQPPFLGRRLLPVSPSLHRQDYRNTTGSHTYEILFKYVHFNCRVTLKSRLLLPKFKKNMK